MQINMLLELAELFRYENLELMREFLLALAFSLICGLIIGGTLELKHKPAGLRTQTLVVTASALFTFLSQAIPDADPTRIAAQIVTGIGFLGAGLILKGDGHRLENVTTAASIWFAASVGMALGFGFYFIGLIAAIVGATLLQISHRRDHENKKTNVKSFRLKR